MYQTHGWWFPDQDSHFKGMLEKNIKKGGGATYQEAVRKLSIDLCQSRGVAIDIGANVGLWSRDLCASFSRVIAIEPVAEFQACLKLNVPAQNLEIQPYALGAEETTINMIITPENTGHTHVDVQSMGIGKIPMHRLDNLDFGKIDYIKIDCEGYENTILQGAKQTVIQNRPIMVVEHKKHKDVGHTDTEAALETLLSWGARILNQVRSDVILGW
jgi:FkbM family methyltransferase